MFYVPVGRGVEEGYLVCTLSPEKTLPAPQPARQTLDVLHSGWERGRGWLPGLYVEPGKDVARSGGKGDDCLLHYPGLLNPPDKHPVVHVQLVLFQEALARRIPGLHLTQNNTFLF
jgi:hypothetical protein